MAPTYLLRGVVPVETQSSVLVSSSKYLNHPRLREWISMICLKKNGPDMPPPAEIHGLAEIIDELRDHRRVEWLFEEERKVNPRFDAWLSEGFVSDYTIDDLKGYAPGTLGGIFYKWITQGNYQIQILPWKKPESYLDFFHLRGGQTHDFEHILCGGGFDSMGELVPYWFRLTNIFKHIESKELAGELSVFSILGTLRYMVRTVLHYPQIWETCVDAIQRGMRVGQESDALFMAKLEDVFHLPLAEAREALGVRGVVDVDTSEQGRIFLDLD